MDSEDICLSVFLCICVGEGMGDKNKLSVPSRTCESGYGHSTHFTVKDGATQ